MRLFTAINLPEHIKSYLFKLEEEIRSWGIAKISFVHKKNLHLTLKFFGDAENVNEIKEKLKNVKFKEFNLVLDKIGVFPSESYIRVVWAGLKDGEELIKLSNKIDEETINKESHEFTGHLTLGRVKFVKDKKSFVEKLSKLKIENLEFTVNEFILFQSILTKDGPEYKIIEKYQSL